MEIEFAPDGKILESEEEPVKKGKKDDDDEDEEDEETVTLNQVPAAVKATILKQAGSNKILEIERESKAVPRSSARSTRLATPPAGGSLPG